MGACIYGTDGTTEDSGEGVVGSGSRREGGREVDGEWGWLEERELLALWWWC